MDEHILMVFMIFAIFLGRGGGPGRRFGKGLRKRFRGFVAFRRGIQRHQGGHLDLFLAGVGIVFLGLVFGVFGPLARDLEAFDIVFLAKARKPWRLPPYSTKAACSDGSTRVTLAR
jgi:hypothetical protein